MNLTDKLARLHMIAIYTMVLLHMIAFYTMVLLLMIAFHRLFHELYKLTHFFVCCYVLVIGSSSFRLIQAIFWTYYSFARAKNHILGIHVQL